MSESIIVDGFDQLIRDFRRIERGLALQIQGELRGIAETVAERARVIARGQGLVGDPKTDRGSGHPGMLVDRIRTSVRGARAYVRATAKRPSAKYPDGFNYPVVFEYGGRGTERTGPRAFLTPALAESSAEVEQRLELMLDRMVDTTNPGGLL